MTHSGIFWSTLLRALLSLRRDKGLAQPSESIDVLPLIDDLENQTVDPQALVDCLERLMPADHKEAINQSVISYLDINKLGPAHAYTAAASNLAEALKDMRQFFALLLDKQCNLAVKKHQNRIELILTLSPLPLLADCQLIYLLMIFRHLAGRRFDFCQLSAPASRSAEPLFLAPLTDCQIAYQGEQYCIGFDEEWLQQPSFFHSPLLRRSLSVELTRQLGMQQSSGLRQKLMHLFAEVSEPAKLRLENIASKFNMAESSFRRKLKSEGISFNSLLKDYIQDAATRRLLNDEKPEDVAISLGFSDRRSFDRSFKDRTGMSAAQFRMLGRKLRFSFNNTSLVEIVETLPPLPDTLQRILAIDDDAMTLVKVTAIIAPDPVFNAHIMGMASKAIYGKRPQTLEEAIGRNLGLSSIKNLAVLFTAQQMLTSQSRYSDVPQLIDAMVFSTTLYRNLHTKLGIPSPSPQEDEQLVMFSLLSLLLVFHQDCGLAEGIVKLFNDAPDMLAFLDAVESEYGICLYMATSLMLTRWGFAHEFVSKLWQLCETTDDAADVHLALPRWCHGLAFTALTRSEQQLNELVERGAQRLGINADTLHHSVQRFKP